MCAHSWRHAGRACLASGFISLHRVVISCLHHSCQACHAQKLPISCHAVQEGLEEPLIAVAAAESDAEELSPLHIYLLKSQRA